jgi:integrase/recombinase XerD
MNVPLDQLMSNSLAVVSGSSLILPSVAVPELFANAGERGRERYMEFFTAQIRNSNTRAAYGVAVGRFSAWCQEKGFGLRELTPVHVATYIEHLCRDNGQSGKKKLSNPTIKQHLAAIRMLFDYLVIGQIVPFNPAASVRGPKYKIKKGKTPVLSGEETKQLLAGIDTSCLIGLRDRALIGVMVFSFARISAVLAMDVEDYAQQGKRWWLRLHEKGGKYHEVPVHRKAEEYLDAYLAAAGIAEDKATPLFRTIDRKERMTANRLSRQEALAMIKRRARAADLGEDICNHTFRATGITCYLLNGGYIEVNQPYCLLCQRYTGLPIRRRSPASQTGYSLIVSPISEGSMPLVSPPIGFRHASPTTRSFQNEILTMSYD